MRSEEKRLRANGITIKWQKVGTILINRKRSCKSNTKAPTFEYKNKEAGIKILL
jgi:hypothetical protein